jgi:hypothetical protein
VADTRRGADGRVRLHRGLVQPAPEALDARLSVPDRVRATPRRTRPTGARSPDLGQRIGRVDLAERLRRAYNASHLDGWRRFRCRPLDLSRERPRPSNRPRSGRDGRWSRDDRQRVASPLCSQGRSIADTNINYNSRDVSSKPGAVHLRWRRLGSNSSASSTVPPREDSWNPCC